MNDGFPDDLYSGAGPVQPKGINEFNCGLYYQKDLLHMNEDGYRKIGPIQAAFLSNGR